MKFFDETGAEIKPEVAEAAVFHILRFVDLKTLSKTRELSRSWRGAIDKKIPFVSEIHRIPSLSIHSVDELLSMTIQPLKGGMTNTSFKLELDKDKWVLRLPGKGSKAFVDREDEAFNATLASDLKINVIIDFFDPKDGLQLTRYLEDNQSITKELLREEPTIISGIAELFKHIHRSTSPFRNTIDVFARNTELLRHLMLKGFEFPDIGSITRAMGRADKLFQQYHIPMKPCHNDATPTNFLLAKGSIKLLDWEYSGNNDLLWDLVYFAVYSELSKKQEKRLLTDYFGECNESMIAWFELYKPVIAWWVLLWAWTQLANKADACPIEAYQALAAEYYQKTKEASESPEFELALSFIERELETHRADLSEPCSHEPTRLPRPF